MIKDSGNRTEFASGAVRDVQSVDKGRCDLMPLDVVSGYFAEPHNAVIRYIDGFQKGGNPEFLTRALLEFAALRGWDLPTMTIEVSIHMAEGCTKYGERNWQKGIPLSRYVDSGTRHFLKWVRGDNDERHDRAVCWNLICGVWTCWHHPELNDYPIRQGKILEGV